MHQMRNAECGVGNMEKARSSPHSALRTPHSAFASDIATLPVSALKGVGPKLKEKLVRLGLQTVQDVLFHLPLRYQDRTRLLRIGGLRPGMEAAVEGEIGLADGGVWRLRGS